MADIHVHVAEGEQSIYPEERIPELLQQGVLTPDTYYWREGMHKWRRLSRFKPSYQAVVPERRTEPLPDPAGRPPRPEPGPPVAREPRSGSSSRRYRFRRNPEPLTTFLRVLVVICMLVTLSELVCAVLDSQSGDASAPSQDNTAQMLEWVGLGLNLFLLVPYCMWIYRTNLNCRTFSSTLTFSSKWAVGCHFVPVLNLIRPYQMMQEIWKVSENPRSWQNDSSSLLVGAWWISWLVTLGLAETSYWLTQQAETPDDWTNAAHFFIWLKIVQLAWYGIFLALITLILRKQVHVVKGGADPANKVNVW
jgi:hypothetical protein